MEKVVYGLNPTELMDIFGKLSNNDISAVGILPSASKFISIN